MLCFSDVVIVVIQLFIEKHLLTADYVPGTVILGIKNGDDTHPLAAGSSQSSGCYKYLSKCNIVRITNKVRRKSSDSTSAFCWGIGVERGLQDGRGSHTFITQDV